MRALEFHPLRQAFCAMELGAQFVCFIVLEHTGLLACFYSCTYFCLAGTVSHQISAGNISQLLFPQVLSGLVACTASCDVATPTASIVIGLLSGLVVSGLIKEFLLLTASARKTID